MVDKLAGLVDNFPGSTVDATKWAVVNGAPTTLSDNRAELPCTTTYPELQSTARWDATSSQITIGVTPPVLVAGSAVMLALAQDSLNGVSWLLQVVTGSSVVFIARTVTAGVNSDLRFVYDASGHAFWRIREQNGYVYWDTSPNGKFWVNQRSAPTTGLDLSNVQVRILCGTTGEAGWVLYGDGLYGDGVYGGGS